MSKKYQSSIKTYSMLEQIEIWTSQKELQVSRNFLTKNFPEKLLKSMELWKLF